MADTNTYTVEARTRLEADKLMSLVQVMGAKYRGEIVKSVKLLDRASEFDKFEITTYAPTRRR